MVGSRLVPRASLGLVISLSMAYSGALAATPALGHPQVNLASSAALLQCRTPDYNYYEQMMIRQARFAQEWSGYSYYYTSLRDFTISGDACSGYYAARATYTYSYGQNGARITGWVEFRFRNGSLDCLTYSTTPGLCRPAS